MLWKNISKMEAEAIMASWSDRPRADHDQQYAKIRQKLVESYKKINEQRSMSKTSAKGQEYDIDLLFGLDLYDYFRNNQNIIKEREASDDGIWRYLSIKVVPDIVFDRWGFNPGRYWRDTRRIWLKVLWWYIHLSWQGSRDATKIVLKMNTTDEIVQLVERSGPSGYRVDLCRQIMKAYGDLDENTKKTNPQILRRIMKLNTARLKVIQPALLQEGEEEYVTELFRYFGIQ